MSKKVCLPIIAALGVVMAMSGCATAPSMQAHEELIKATGLTEPADVAVVEKALEVGDLPKARALLEQSALSGQESPEWQVLLAEYYLQSGNAASARASFKELLEDPDFGARARQGLGISLLILSSTSDALAVLNQAVSGDPALWQAWNALGILHDRDGRFAEAIVSYSRAIELQPKRAELRSNRGFSLLLKGEVDPSIAELTKALELNPQARVTKTNLRLALALKGDYVAALSGAGQSETRTLLNNAGFAAMARGDIANAEAFFVRAIEESPAYYSLASQNLKLVETLKAGEAAR